MKGATLILTVLLLFTLGFSGCSKNCDPQLATCSEIPPTDEACLAFFQKWFYNKGSNKCEEIGYSGCSDKGFSTQQECEECRCG